MSTHTIRQTITKFGFVIDNEIIICLGANKTIGIHLNKGPKEPEDYKQYTISGQNFALENEPDKLICSEHLYIDIEFSYDGPYMRGFIANFLESDLNHIQPEGMSDILGVFSDDNMSSIKRKTPEHSIQEYLTPVFGEVSAQNMTKHIHEYYGVQLFRKRIYLNTFCGRFAINLSDIPLKKEFEQLIEMRIATIKRLLFKKEIPEGEEYVLY